MDEYTVIGFDTHDSRSIHPFEVYRAKGESTKDVQDKIAAHAGERPHIIYTVVLTEDYRASIRRNAFNAKGV